MERTNYSSGAKWEEIVGYSRAVRVGNIIEVTGTVAVNENTELVGGDSAYEQTRFIITKIEKVFTALQPADTGHFYVCPAARTNRYNCKKNKAEQEAYQKISIATLPLIFAK